MTSSFPFLKGHGTENDFVLLPDPDGHVHPELSSGLVAALCDRRAGIGGDGVIRVVRCAASTDPAAVAARDRAEWFMDYRNADGSLSEMCGNGVRVFARYLAEHQRLRTDRPTTVATRAGLVELTFPDGTTAQVSADMGAPRVLGETTIRVGDRSWPATHVNMGNPHAVAFVDDLADAGSLRESPTYDPAVYPDGVNVEFAVRRGAHHVAMRVHERGSGETRSCGTGACAVLVAAALTDPTGPVPAGGPAAELTYRVDVPGGTLSVTWTEANRVLLTGPAVLVARGEVPNSFAGGT